jgi:hypothetical protein
MFGSVSHGASRSPHSEAVASPRDFHYIFRKNANFVLANDSELHALSFPRTHRSRSVAFVINVMSFPGLFVSQKLTCGTPENRAGM